MEEHSVLLFLLLDFEVHAVVVLEEEESGSQLCHHFAADELKEFAEEVPGHVSRLLMIILLQQRQQALQKLEKVEKVMEDVRLLLGKRCADLVFW